MDILKKQEELKDKKIEILENIDEEIVRYFVVYLFHNDDIVYIGRTTNYIEYVKERKDKYNATHYTIEEINVNEIDNYIAELILELQPIYNNQLPNANTKYISSNMAKKDYRIGKPEIKKIYKEYGGYEFRNSIYIKKTIFNDIFAKTPYHKDMPKIGKKIYLVDNYKMAHINQFGGVVQDTLFDEDGNEVEAFVNYVPDVKKEYESVKYLEDKKYEVIELIDSETFEAVNYDNGKRVVLKASDSSYTWSSFDENESYKDKWVYAIDERIINGIKNRYLELIDKEQNNG